MQAVQNIFRNFFARRLRGAAGYGIIGHMKVYVVRHCSTECSEKKIYCGSTDIPLSARGEREAERLKELAAGYDFGVIFSSPLIRARQTAEALACARDIPIIYDGRLAERRFGDLEQTSCESTEGKACRYSIARRYPNGESNLQVAARIYRFLDEATAKHADGNICIVSHGSACRLIRTYFKDMTDEEFYAYSHPNGTIEEYEL